tara:strand:- start:1154 stop:1513 length:360 start_codon:yes stop_codon:yes gene_type:complete
MTNANRVDNIFCKMLNTKSQNIGIVNSPYIITEHILKQGLILGRPTMMKHLKDFLISNHNENRMIVWTVNGKAWAVMNTTRTSLDGTRTIEWTNCDAPPLPKIYNTQYTNPVWVTTYRE